MQYRVTVFRAFGNKSQIFLTEVCSDICCKVWLHNS